MADLKPVYRAVSKEAAEIALDELDENGGSNIRWYFSCGGENGPICRVTSGIRRRSVRSFTRQKPLNQCIASLEN